MEAEAMPRGTETQQEPEGFRALDRVHAELDDVAKALERLDQGTYGGCQTCGGTIADELLSAQPAARNCRECHSG